MRQQVLKFGAALVMACAGATALIWACGPAAEELVTVATVYPANADAYAQGEIGVVRPNYARRYLLNAYRILSGAPPLRDLTAADLGLSPYSYPGRAASDEWRKASASALGQPQPGPYVEQFASSRLVAGSDYQEFDNCLDAAFQNATRTLGERQARFGAASDNVREWTRAQNIVFYNCGNARTLMVPQALAAGADPLLRADREYQIASAHFYGMQYDEAARRFAAIANDPSSPWRTYGRYLAGRARIRQATMATDTPRRAGLFALADTELSATLADPSASALHASAQGLQLLIEDRARPINRLRSVTTQLATGEAAGPHDFEDYTRLLDRFVGDTIDIGIERLDPAVLGTGDATDWVLTFQARDRAATTRAIERWQATKSLPWLIAVLWKIPPGHALAAEVLDAAASIRDDSPGFATTAFLRVRLLAARGHRAEARAVLATLPHEPRQRIDAESVNFFKAERLMLADTFEEFIGNAARTPVNHPGDPAVFDGDAGDLLTYHFPLNRLLDAATSPSLPAHLRLEIAAAALSRAIVLKQDEAGRRAATALRLVSPPAIHADLDRYLTAATPDDRRWAAIVLMLRTPGLHAYVSGPQYRAYQEPAPPARAFDRLFHDNWWCISATGDFTARWSEFAPLRFMLYEKRPLTVPAFLTPLDATTTAQELAAIVAAGNPRELLATEALARAKTRPSDPLLAEMLALVVQGGRFTHCADPSARSLSQRAFQTLHRLFPGSEWARRTRYWYG